MIRIKVLKLSIVFEFSFFLLAAIICSSDAVDILLFIMACVIHEAGHTIMLYSIGGSIKKVIFSGFGIIIVPDKKRILSAANEAVVMLSGPAANLAVILFAPFNTDFIYINLMLAFFNLMPFSTLDGGCLIDTVCEHFGCLNLSLAIKKVLCAIIILLIIIIAFLSGLNFIYLVLIYGCIKEIFF